MPDPRDMLATLLNPITITADDGSTILSVANGNLQIKKHPYPEERVSITPTVVVGPVVATRTELLRIGGNPTRVLYRALVDLACSVRDMDKVGTSKLTGVDARNKLIEAVRNKIRQSMVNPDGAANFLALLLRGDARDFDENERPLTYRSVLTAEAWWVDNQ